MRSERIALSEKYNVCGTALWIMELFNRFGYMRPVEYDKSLFLKFVYHLRTITFISIQFGGLVVAEVAAIYMYWPDVPRISGAIYIMSANLTHAIKLCNLIVNRNVFLSLIDFFVKSISETDLNDSEVRNLLVSFEKKSFRDLVFIFCCSIAAVMGLAGIGNGGDIMDPSGLPLVAYYPFEIQHFPVFQLVYLYQMLAALIAATFNVTLDIFSTNLVLQLCCQFRLLKRDIRLIREIAPDKDEEISRQLSEIIERHCILKRKCFDLGSTYGVTILGQFLGSISIFGICFYQFYRASDTNLVTVLSIFSTFYGALLQAFIYCYYGNEIKIESESVGQELMDLPWYFYSQSNKKLLLVMIHMGQRPIIMRAGFVDITLQTLMSIMKTSYSAFSVMVNIDKKGI